MYIYIHIHRARLGTVGLGVLLEKGACRGSPGICRDIWGLAFWVEGSGFRVPYGSLLLWSGECRLG